MTLKTGAGSLRKYHYLHSKYHFVENDLLVNFSLNMKSLVPKRYKSI